MTLLVSGVFQKLVYGFEWVVVTPERKLLRKAKLVIDY